MSEDTYDLLKDYDAFKQIPILTLDQRWYKLVPDAIKTHEIKYWEGQVNELLKRQGQITNDLKEVKKIKAKVIQDVVDNMESDDTNPKKQKLMDKNQKLIQEAKSKIADLEDEELEIPAKLRRANQNLLIETVKMCYSHINSNKEDIEVLDKWIEATRIKLKKNLLIKQEKENVNDQMYSAMHDILGPEVMGELDKIFETD